MERAMANMDSVRNGSRHTAPSDDGRAAWERPLMRRLAANKAEGGGRPCDDGVGNGGCSHNNQHS
jgi:hypothetical protein